jgi:acyl-CoA thioester hydrolase
MKSSTREGGDAGMSAFTVTKRVRLADTDATGALYFGAYGRIVEIAEVEFFRSLDFGPDVFSARGVMFTRVRVELDFFKPALVDDLLTLRISVAGVGIHSVRFAVGILRDQTLIAESMLVSACVDRDRKSVAIPDDIALALRERQFDL